MPDYPLAQEHFVPRSFMFNSNAQKAIVIHKTGGDATPAAVYNTFINSGNPGKSVHYAVGQDGSIWQYVPEALGAGGNGVTDSTTQAFWRPYMAQYGNLNTCTISIEHCDPSPRNDTPLTPAQKQASFALVAYLTKKYAIAADHIKPHSSICATACPGTYPMQELVDFINNQERGTWVSASQAQQAQDVWNSSAPGGSAANYSTGIAQSWQNEYMNGKVWGPPMSQEIHTVNWTGGAIVMQIFPGGRCEWDGSPHWYAWQ